MSIYRNRDLLDLARLAPHCMGCLSANYGSVVAAHSNSSRHGKGMGIKAADWAVAYCCHGCHAEIDQGKGDGSARSLLWELAHIRTMNWLFGEGHLVVAEEARRPDAPVKVRAREKRSRPIRSNPKIQSRGFDKPRAQKDTAQ